MSEPLQYCCEEHGHEGYTPCPKCKPPASEASPAGMVPSVTGSADALAADETGTDSAGRSADGSGPGAPDEVIAIWRNHIEERMRWIRHNDPALNNEYLCGMYAAYRRMLIQIQYVKREALARSGQRACLPNARHEPPPDKTL